MPVPPSWKAEPVGGCPASITQTLPASVAGGSGTFGHPLTCSLQRWTWPVDSLHCARPSLALWVSGIGTKALTSHLYFMEKKKRRKSGDTSHVLMLPQSTKVERKLFKLVIGQNLQNEGRALFCPIFLYMHWLFFSLVKMKANLTSGMPEKKLRILFAWTILMFGDLKKKSSKYKFLL